VRPHRHGIAAVIAVVALGACRGGEPYDKPPTPVQVADLGHQTGTQALRYSGSVEPGHRVDLTFRVGGYITSLASISGREIQDGDVVSAGTVLASVRVDDYDAKVSQANAALAEGEAARVAAAAALARAEELFKARAATRPDVEQARAQVAAIDAKIAGAKALIRESELARGDSSLKAPISGQILKRLVEVGSLVGPGTPGFVIADNRTVKVVIGVADTILARFKTGAPLSIITEALADRRFSGHVSKVSPTADPRSRLFEVELTLPNADGALKPGMVATVDISADGEARPAPQLTLPLPAIVRAPGGGNDAYAVFVVEQGAGGAVARVRKVTLGALVGNAVTVTSGLTGSEQVVVRGAALLTDGERVNSTR
jgi:RND family efflux transporter MFP subunit